MVILDIPFRMSLLCRCESGLIGNLNPKQKSCRGQVPDNGGGALAKPPRRDEEKVGNLGLEAAHKAARVQLLH